MASPVGFVDFDYAVLRFKMEEAAVHASMLLGSAACQNMEQLNEFCLAQAYSPLKITLPLAAIVRKGKPSYQWDAIGQIHCRIAPESQLRLLAVR